MPCAFSKKTCQLILKGNVCFFADLEQAYIAWKVPSLASKKCTYLNIRTGTTKDKEHSAAFTEVSRTFSFPGYQNVPFSTHYYTKHLQSVTLGREFKAFFFMGVLTFLNQSFGKCVGFPAIQQKRSHCSREEGRWNCYSLVNLNSKAYVLKYLGKIRLKSVGKAMTQLFLLITICNNRGLNVISLTWYWVA